MASDLVVKMKLALDQTDFGKNISLADTDNAKFTKSLGLATAGMASFAAGSAILGTVGKAAVSLSLDFENGFNKISTLFGDVQVDTENLKKNINDLAKASGVSAEEIQEGYYGALSAGVPVTEDMAASTKFMESALKLARGGFTSIDKAVDGTTTILNSYGMEVGEAENVMDKLITTQNLGKTTVDQLAASYAGVIPTAASMGVSFDQVSAAMVVMTSQGTPTAQAVTSLNALLAEMGKTGTVASKKFEELSGSTFQDFIASGGDVGQAIQIMTKDMTGATEEIKKLTDSGMSYDDAFTQVVGTSESADQGLIDMFGSIEAAKAAMQLGADEGNKYAAALDGVESSSGATSEAATKMETTQFKLNQAIESFKSKLREIGDYLLEKMGPAIDFYIANSEVINTVLAITVITIGILLVVFGALAIIMAVVNVVMLASPITWIILGIVALIAAVVLLAVFWDEIWAYMNQVVANVKEYFVGVWENVKAYFIGMWENIKAYFIGVWNNIKDFFINTWNAIKDFFVNIWNGIKDFFINIWNGIKDFFINFVTWFKNTWESIKTFINNIVMNIRNWFVDKFTQMVNFVKNIPNIVSTAFNNIKKFIVDSIRGAIDWSIQKFNDFVSFVKGIPGKIGAAFKGLFDNVKNMAAGVGEALVNGIKGTINNFLISPLNAAVGLINKIPGVNIGTIPMLANGGIVDQATMAIIGEKGPEAVVPLTQKGISAFMDKHGINGRGGGNTINIEIQGILDEKMAHRIVDIVDDELGMRLI